MSVDLNAVGDGLVTVNNITGLQWLDLTETNYESYNNISAQLGSGGAFDGWRYASDAEVISMWADFGVNVSASGIITAAGLNPLIDEVSFLFGDLFNILDPGGASGLLGYTSDVNSLSGGQSVIGASNDLTATENMAWNVGSLGFAGDDSTAEFLGSYLVRQPSLVPIPAAAWLFGSGLFTLVGLSIRKNHIAMLSSARTIINSLH